MEGPDPEDWVDCGPADEGNEDTGWLPGNDQFSQCDVQMGVADVRDLIPDAEALLPRGWFSAIHGWISRSRYETSNRRSCRSGLL